MLDAALENGGRDNITIIVLDVDDSSDSTGARSRRDCRLLPSLKQLRAAHRRRAT